MALLDLIRAPWKHSDPVRRAEAVRALEGDRREVFLALATSDPDAHVRLAAAKRLADEADLRKALERSSEGPARDAIREKLARVVAEWASTEPEVDAFKAQAWLEELDALSAPEKVFAEIAARAPAISMRQGALARLAHASSFHAVALRETDDALALEACSRLEKPSHLESVAREARSAAVRKSARERLRALEKTKGPDEAAQNRAKLAILLATAERVSARAADTVAGFDWDSAREQVEEAVAALDALAAAGLPASAAERAHFAANVAAFRDRHAAHAAIKAARRARDAEEARESALREDACDEMEALFSDPKPVEAARVEEVERRFHSTGAADKHDPTRERFRIALARVRDRLRRESPKENPEPGPERKSRPRSDAAPAHPEIEANPEAQKEQEALKAKRREEREKREADKKAARADAAKALEGFAAELEAIMAAADFKGAEKKLRELRERGNAAVAFLGKGSEHAESIGRFQSATGRLRETLDWNQWAHKKHKEEMDQAREANIAAKTAFCEEVEKLDALPDDEARHARILELQASWKATGHVPREQGEALWARFRKPIDAFFQGRRARAAAALEDDEGVQIREDICTEAESLAAPGALDRRDAAEKVRTLQAEWHAAPPVPAHVERKLWARFRKACDKAFGDTRG